MERVNWQHLVFELTKETLRARQFWTKMPSGKDSEIYCTIISGVPCVVQRELESHRYQLDVGCVHVDVKNLTGESHDDLPVFRDLFNAIYDQSLPDLVIGDFYL